MKERTGFVSNSSSSSFILVSRDGKPPLGRISIEFDAVEYGCTAIMTIEELNEWFAYEYGLDCLTDEYCDYEREQYEEMKEAIDGGKVLYVGTATNEGYGDNGLELHLFRNGFDDIRWSGDVEVMQEPLC